MPTARKLGRRADQRRAMLRGMVTLLLDKGRIETTLARAKELKRVADKMVTIGKKNTLAAKRMAFAYITKEEVVKKLFDKIAPSFEDRNGGYTRVLKLGPRRGDGAEMAIIELVNYTPKDKKDKKDKSKKEKPDKETDSKKEVKDKDKKEDKKEAKEVKTPKVAEAKEAEPDEIGDIEEVDEIDIIEEIDKEAKETEE